MQRKNVTYLVHDLGDAAVSKRIRMMKHAGANLSLAGFYRSEKSPVRIEDISPTGFAKTANGGFLNRILNVLKTCFTIKKHVHLFENTDIIVARNLEMLAIAGRAKSALGLNATIIYESLDIHRLLLRNDPIGIILRKIEKRLAKHVDKLWTSSPAFIEEYFEARNNLALPIQLVENKIFDPEGQFSSTNPTSLDTQPPWVIGWFGAIRCSKSLDSLTNLAKTMDGRVKIIIRGKPSYDQIPDFDDIIAASDYISFEGAYKNPDDLASIYGQTHFTWAIDMFEEGLNSSWLLPNRLYEGGAFDAVPIAIESVETGRMITNMNIGITIPDANIDTLKQLFENMTPENYTALKQKSQSIAKTRWFHDDQECHSLLEIPS